MTALNWQNMPGHEAQWRADIFRTNAEGEVRIFQGDQVWHVNAKINGHHYETSWNPTFMAKDVRRLAGQWIDRLIEQQQEDANA